MMQFRAFICCTLLTISLLSCTEQTAMFREDKPNIVLILTDDQGWGDLSSSGNTNLSTPNIDEMAREGVRFDRFYVCAVCSPTRAEILTGRYSARTGVSATSRGQERIDLDEETIAEVLLSNGYKTAAFGKWHNGMQYPYHPNGRGFEEFYGFCSGHWGNYFDPMLEHNGEIIQGEGFIIDDFTNKAMEFIEKHRSSPFFVYLPFNTPHSPMQVPDRWWSKFENATLEKFHREQEKEKISHTKAALALVENIDWNVGRIRQKLKELELEDNTILMYLSDNGPNGARWNDGMKGRKGSTDEGGVRSPLIMHWNNQFVSGKIVPQIASSVDFLPTIVALTHSKFSGERVLDGINLSPLLYERNPQWEDRILINHWKDRISVRNQKYRLDYQGQLFDMVNDPGQSTDISKQVPDVWTLLQGTRKHFEDNILIELPEVDNRPFPLGHIDYAYTQIPARDGEARGAIKRSNRWPNCSYFTNWINTDDSIIWEVEVMHEDDYEVEIYYTCEEQNTGCEIKLDIGSSNVSKIIEIAHDPPYLSVDKDRDERGESFVKRFRPLKMGSIHLSPGQQKMVLTAPKIIGNAAIDFRLMMFKRDV